MYGINSNPPFFSLSKHVIRFHILGRLKDKYPNFEVGLKCIIMVF